MALHTEDGERENPSPKVVTSFARPGTAKAYAAQLADFGLQTSEEDVYLKELAGVECLDEAVALQVIVDTQVTTISHLGAKLPVLKELNLNNSSLSSLRDLGTSFQQLQVLWLARCGLVSFEGISALPALRELYAAYNDISDIQDLNSCSDLEILDLEGNSITDLESVYYLTDSRHLSSLTLAGNPVARSPVYRYTVCSKLRQLQALDDVAVSKQDLIRPQTDDDVASDPVNNPSTMGDSAASTGMPAEFSATDNAITELTLVLEGIKHLRVGVDSQEFLEIGMSQLLDSDIPPDLAPTASTSLLPSTTSTWLRTLRSSREGSLANLRQSNSCLPHSTNWPADMASRPSTAFEYQQSSTTLCSGVAQAPSSSSHHSSTESSRPGSSGGKHVRPASAWLGTSAPTTSSCTAATSSLYWRKNRLDSSRIWSPDALPNGEQGEEVADTSSRLTMGSASVLGGNLARGLRLHKNSARLVQSEGNVASFAVPGKPTQNLEQAAWLNYGPAELLGELRRWKLDTADKVLMAEEDVGTSSWHSNGPGGSIDVLALSSPAGATSSSVSPDAEVSVVCPPVPSGLAPLKTRNSKLMLAKVVRDADNISDVKSTAQDHQSVHSVSSPRSNLPPRHPSSAPSTFTTSLSRLSSSRSSLPAQETGHASIGSTRRQPSAASSVGSCAGDDSMSVRSQDSQPGSPFVLGISGAQTLGDNLSAYVTSGKAYLTTCAAGELDLRSVNPRPAFRQEID